MYSSFQNIINKNLTLLKKIVHNKFLSGLISYGESREMTCPRIEITSCEGQCGVEYLVLEGNNTSHHTPPTF